MRLLQYVGLLALLGVTVAQLSCEQGGCGHGFCHAIGAEKSRCKCDKGWMGLNCARPCQDVFKSCVTRWEKEKRCHWAKGRTLWFDDNCSETCGQCTPDKNNKLRIPFPPLLEPLAWMVGVWETQTSTNKRYPMNTIGPYKETLIVQQTNVTMFDRPSLNLTAIAQTIGDPTDLHMDLGFLTSKLVIEDTGFNNADKAVKDEVGIELNSNTGMNTVEEGELNGQEITVKTTWKKALPQMEGRMFESSKRTFKSFSATQMEEIGEIKMSDGTTKTWAKYFNRVADVLAPM